MHCTTARLRRAAFALAFGAGLVAVPAGAQDVTVNFNTLTVTDGSGIRYIGNCYMESGFTFSAVGLPCDSELALAVWGADNPLFYTGTPALLNNEGTAVDFATSLPGTFSMRSISLAPGLGVISSNATVTFTGFRAGGGTVFQQFMLAGNTTGVQSFMFNSDFTGLTSVRLAVLPDEFDETFVQFDDVMFSDVRVIPEPATIMLLATGLVAIGAVARRRRTRS